MSRFTGGRPSVRRPKTIVIRNPYLIDQVVSVQQETGENSVTRAVERMLTEHLVEIKYGLHEHGHDDHRSRGK